ncbi:NAD(P)H-hydrate dehydratase [Patescibacteria group bacterium]|nr:NAD(P)H-hydrate dehydratase [Patescibacteria group bacterium]
MGSINSPEKTSAQLLNLLQQPSTTSRKKDNGRLVIIGGSKLFHGAAIWAVKTASRLADLVFFSSVQNVLETAQKALLADFIPVMPHELTAYANEADVILIGPGLLRNLTTRRLTKRVLRRWTNKPIVIDAGSLQTIEPKFLKPNHILTPNIHEYLHLFSVNQKEKKFLEQNRLEKVVSHVQKKAGSFGGIVLLKGKTDVIAAPNKVYLNQTGHEGMTKGGTGDVLAGLVAALCCHNPPLLAAAAGAYLNGLAGEELAKKQGFVYNASDLCNQLPLTWKKSLKK